MSLYTAHHRSEVNAVAAWIHQKAANRINAALGMQYSVFGTIAVVLCGYHFVLGNTYSARQDAREVVGNSRSASIAHIQTPQATALSGHRPSLLDTPSRPPYQFMGWKYASRRGGNYLARFSRQRNGTLTSVSHMISGQSVFTSEYVAALGGSSAATLASFLLPQSLPANFLPT